MQDENNCIDVESRVNKYAGVQTAFISGGTKTTNLVSVIVYYCYCYLFILFFFFSREMYARDSLPSSGTRYVRFYVRETAIRAFSVNI